MYRFSIYYPILQLLNNYLVDSEKFIPGPAHMLDNAFGSSALRLLADAVGAAAARLLAGSQNAAH
ncbi:hypothetical protein [Aromatoleum anaerobium]|uniref:Uncharacterized protein n=1 Tax=Aromatoleum anaerobium TaxID=182180 RepID=A0ABX1PPE2_9RHOO|nr:hypothetical protein [Aromatoleum anaerobium]MCK0508428.1 hypothetical protein [Aromatoleum anaerobium]